MTQGPTIDRARATALGFLAVLMWALLALFSVGAGAVPPFQLTALCFALAGAAGLVYAMGRPQGLRRALGQPPRVWALGVVGLFGYHALYFTAVQNAPPARASLIAYLWPLLIVLFSGLLPGETLRRGHVLGALAALAGAVLVIAPGVEDGSNASPLGYAAAGACALVWSGYSVLSRRVGDAPTEAVAAFCLAAAMLSALCHLAFETTVWPDGALGWASVVGLGLGPVGAAFYVWDIGMKRGDIQLLGVAAYAAPLLSTVALVAAGIAAPTLALGLAAALITGGALLAAQAGRTARRGA
jgi:drug/metabolite transporter (DMT)-like permease